ncbi:kinase-like protein [Rhizophagus irregularis]|uniref:Kinase-like protein n=1 Tax=Rhizophagus irregularis TaxID=588596 RepID=A0A2N0RKL6_9GLOM|nr:kinase-like protein [Rhizophagus irregularis]
MINNTLMIGLRRHLKIHDELLRLRMIHGHLRDLSQGEINRQGINVNAGNELTWNCVICPPMIEVLGKFGKSGNIIMDNFILEKKLKWVPYKKFKDVEYLNEGGFGSVYKATWLKENGDMEVVLKCPKDLNENLSKFLKEWKYHESCLDSTEIINLYGFTRNPDSKYMAIMDYANKGNLRENLTKIIKNNWKQRLYILYKIISGLHKIHEQNLIHCDFHDGNILKHNKYKNNLKDDESQRSTLSKFQKMQIPHFPGKWWEIVENAALR